MRDERLDIGDDVQEFLDASEVAHSHGDSISSRNYRTTARIKDLQDRNQKVMEDFKNEPSLWRLEA